MRELHVRCIYVLSHVQHMTVTIVLSSFCKPIEIDYRQEKMFSTNYLLRMPDVSVGRTFTFLINFLNLFNFSIMICIVGLNYLPTSGA